MTVDTVTSEETPSVPGDVQWTGNQSIESISTIDPKSEYGPALASYQGFLYMVYRGALTDDLYMATFDGSDWVGNQKISDMPGGIDPKSNYTPSIIEYMGKLYMVYKGAHSDDLFVATFDGKYWTGNQEIADMPGGIEPKSNYTPAIADYQGYLYMAYKGAHSNELYLTHFDGESWRGNQKISDMPGDIDPKSTLAPAMAAYDDQLWLIYKGENFDHLYQATYDGSSWAGNIKIENEPETTGTPALAVFNGGLFMTYTGDNFDSIFQNVLSGTTWDGNVKISDISAIEPESAEEPGMGVLGPQLFMVYRGGTTENIYQSIATAK